MHGPRSEPESRTHCDRVAMEFFEFKPRNRNELWTLESATVRWRWPGGGGAGISITISGTPSHESNASGRSPSESPTGSDPGPGPPGRRRPGGPPHRAATVARRGGVSHSPHCRGPPSGPPHPAWPGAVTALNAHFNGPHLNAAATDRMSDLDAWIRAGQSGAARAPPAPGAGIAAAPAAT